MALVVAAPLAVVHRRASRNRLHAFCKAAEPSLASDTFALADDRIFLYYIVFALEIGRGTIFALAVAQANDLK